MWFTEDPWPPMLLCGVGAIVAVAFWSSSKRVLPLVISALCCVLAGGVYLVEAAILTPAEQVEGLVVQLCHEFQRKDQAALAHFSNTAPTLRDLCASAMELVEVDNDLRLTDFQTRVTNQESRVVTQFRANATLKVQGFGSVGHQPARIELTWAKEGTDWKIIALRRMHPLKDEEMEVLAKQAN
jgi:hypothetical protein